MLTRSGGERLPHKQICYLPPLPCSVGTCCWLPCTGLRASELLIRGRCSFWDRPLGQLSLYRVYWPTNKCSVLFFPCRKASPQPMAHPETAPSSRRPERGMWATPSCGRATSPSLSSTRASTAGSSTPASPPRSQACRGTRQRPCRPRGRLSHPSGGPPVAPSRRRGPRPRQRPINNVDRHRQLRPRRPRTDPRWASARLGSACRGLCSLCGLSVTRGAQPSARPARHRVVLSPDLRSAESAQSWQHKYVWVFSSVTRFCSGMILQRWMQSWAGPVAGEGCFRVCMGSTSGGCRQASCVLHHESNWERQVSSQLTTQSTSEDLCFLIANFSCMT